MRHPTEGTLRRLLDEPAGVADADREHVAGCATCLVELTAAREDAARVAAALDVDVHVDVDAAWRRFSAAAAEEARPAAPAAARAPARPSRVRSPLAAGLAVLVVLVGASAVAAADWLQIFRTERIAMLSLTQADLVALPDLTAYGTVEVVEEPDVREVADAAAARAATGLPTPRVRDLPRGVVGEPELQVGGRLRAEFTFSLEQAERAAAEAGAELPPAPPGLDGSAYRLVAGPGLAAVWSEARGVPALVVARAVAPAAFSSGVPFETARDYLLSLPGLPESVASQLRGFSGDGTLPVPLPPELVQEDAVDVGGARATVLASRDGVLAALVWVENGHIVAVGGSLGTDELVAVARALRWEA